jgi:hypothetical protein
MMEDAIFSVFLVDLIIIFLILLLILWFFFFFNFEEKMFWSFIIIYEKRTPCS